MNQTKWEQLIKAAYDGRNRSKLWLASGLIIESSELAEIVHKYEGYQVLFTTEQILSEAGDVLNFLTALLQEYDLTLDQAMENNKQKLLSRGWVKNEKR